MNADDRLTDMVRRLGAVVAGIAGLCTIALMLAVTIALIMLLFGANPAKGAPVPPAPRDLTAEQLVGRWSLEWGEREGTVWFFADGSYVKSFPESDIVLHGQWSTDRGALVLHEWRFDPECQSESGPEFFRIPLDQKRYPARLSGPLNEYGLARVVMTDPKR